MELHQKHLQLQNPMLLMVLIQSTLQAQKPLYAETENAMAQKAMPTALKTAQGQLSLDQQTPPVLSIALESSVGEMDVAAVVNLDAQQDTNATQLEIAPS
jgi:hypothetical protein